MKYFLTFVLLTSLALMGQNTVEEQRQELYQTRAQLELTEKRISDLRSERARLTHTLQQDDVQLARVRSLSAEIAAAEQDKQEMIDRIRRAMYSIGQQMDAQKQELAQQLVSMYKYGRVFDLELLLSSQSMPDVYKKMFYMQMVAEANKQRIEQLAGLQADLVVQQSHFRYAAATLQSLQDEYERQRRLLQSDRDFRAASVANLKREETHKLAQGERLSQAAAELESLFDRLESQPQASAAPAQVLTKSSGLPWPVTGKVSMGFGVSTDTAAGSVRQPGP